MTAPPTPPMPDICGSATVTTAAAATAASNAFPPSRRTSMPACDASQWPDATRPVPLMRTGRVAPPCGPASPGRPSARTGRDLSALDPGKVVAISRKEEFGLLDEGKVGALFEQHEL